MLMKARDLIQISMVNNNRPPLKKSYDGFVKSKECSLKETYWDIFGSALSHNYDKIESSYTCFRE